MPSLQVREVPEVLYKKLTQRAKEQHRSIAQETIHILSEKLDIEESPKKKQEKLLEEINKLHKQYDFSDLPDPVEIIRKDRQR